MTRTDPGLLWLSLRHVYHWRWWSVRPFPHILTNEQRLMAYRGTVAPVVGNTMRWKWHDYPLSG